MKIKDRYEFVISYFQKNIPNAATELIYETPYQLLVAVILSAQCTDARVNKTTPNFFAHYPTPQVLASASVAHVFTLIHSISYPNSKAKYLVGMANMLLTTFNGEVPMNVEALQKLPGVGRKTANVVTSVIDLQPNMAVDTHVFRVSARLGLTIKSKNVLETERQLIKHLPTELVRQAHHWLILHGRYTCTARNPKCTTCGLQTICVYVKTKNIRIQ